MAVRRLRKEMQEIEKMDDVSLTLGGEGGDDLFSWTISLVAPAASPYAASLLRVSVNFPNDYPFKPPRRVCFLDPIPLHPNIDDNGEIGCCVGPWFCCGSEEWAPALSMSMPKMLSALRSLLVQPHAGPPDRTNKPRNHRATMLYQANRSKYEWLARRLRSFAVLKVFQQYELARGIPLPDDEIEL